MRDKDLDKLTEELLRRGVPEGGEVDPNLVAGLIDGGLIEEEQELAEGAVAGDEATDLEADALERARVVDQQVVPEFLLLVESRFDLRRG